MTDAYLGRSFRALRLRAGLRQVDLARRAEVSQQLISRIELGGLDVTSVRVLRSMAEKLGANLRVELRWRGASLDRLLDEGHATLAGAAADRLREAGWLVQPEVTYSHYGERGSVDMLAWHPPGHVLVVELKTELASIEETLRRLDQKVRLAPMIGRDRFGWSCEHASRLVVVSENRTTRRRVSRHAAVLGPALPLRGAEVRRWLAVPTGRMDGLLFLTGTTRHGGRSVWTPNRRVRCRGRGP